MPAAGPRLARALLPYPRPWQLLGAAAATVETAVPLRVRTGALGLAWKRPYTHATRPCRRPETQSADGSGDGDDQPPSHERPTAASPASASIFEELFPGEVRPHDRDAYDADEQVGSGPGPEEVLEEIQQWLQSEVEAGEARRQDASASATATATATATTTLRTPRGDWGRTAAAAASPRSSPSVTAAPSLSQPAERYAQPTVLVLSGTTPSLMPSDFFRIAPRITDSSNSGDGSDERSPSSRPVDGWSASNGGIYKIVQDRDPVTLAPRGRYFLYFGSPAAALAYAQEMRELHKLARRAVVPAESGKSNSRRLIRRRNDDRNAMGHADAFAGSESSADASETDPFAHVTGSITTSSSGLAINHPGSARGVDGGRSSSAAAAAALKQRTRRVKNSYSNASLLAHGSEEQIEALRNFSLVVPTVRLHLSVQMPSADGPGLYTARTSSKKARKNAQVTLYDGEALDDVAATDTTTKVLVVLTSVANSTGAGSYSSYINADGRGVTTIDGLRSLIAEDGARRNMPWGVSYGMNGVVPVRWLVEEQTRLLRKARAAALQSQDAEAEAEGEAETEADAETTLEQKLAGALGAETAAVQDPPVAAADARDVGDDKKQPALPTALWASRVPDLTSKTAQMDGNGRFSRFVVSFTHNAEARRFVRGWHRRTVNVRLEHAMSRSNLESAVDVAIDRGDADADMRIPAIVEASVVW